MLQNANPLAMFSEDADTAADETLISEHEFNEHVATGRSAEETLVLESAWYVFYCLKGEAWRFKAMAMMLDTMGRMAPMKTSIAWPVGLLLGYTNEENNRYIERSTKGGSGDSVPSPSERGISSRGGLRAPTRVKTISAPARCSRSLDGVNVLGLPADDDQDWSASADGQVAYVRERKPVFRINMRQLDESLCSGKVATSDEKHA